MINYLQMILFSCVVIFLPLIIGSDRVGYASRVLELSDRFLEIRKDGIWLVKFYAPWCGHCKKLEPIYSHVAQALHDTPIRVARVDCTRFPTVGTEFQVHGFPTIMFLKGPRRDVYTGERETEEIVAYAKRMAGPAVRELEQYDSFDTLAERISTFFGFVGEEAAGEEWEAFAAAAEDYQATLDFYAFSPKQIPQRFSLSKAPPLIMTYKDGELLPFTSTDPAGNISHALSSWIMRERFPKFVKVCRSNFQGLLGTKKFLVMAVVEEDKLGRISEDMQRFKDMIQEFTRQFEGKYRKNFQFGWVGSPELANSVAMTTLSIPSLLVVNSTSYHHHIPEDEPHHLTPQAIHLFLEQLVNQTATAYGGNTWSVRMYRSYYEAKTSLVNMWSGNPVLTALLFGLPLGFMSLIFYSICCADIMDAQEDEDDPLHEKKE